MLLLKRIDIIVQLLLIVAALIYGFTYRHDFEFLPVYYIVGGWQLLSFFLHIHPFLIIAGPAMATFYTALCFVETFNLIRHENK
jgi:hypothetical protein